MKRIAVVINPVAGGGQGKKIWRILNPGLNALFDNITYRMSNQVNELATITHGLLAQKPDYLLIIGGDGTLNHALNGMIVNDSLINQSTKIAFFNAGSGGDFIRSFPQQKITEFLDRLIHNQSVQCNVGKITLSNQLPYYFINIASCGLSGCVVQSVTKSRFLKKLGGSLNYLLHAIWGLIVYRRAPVQIQIDDAQPFDCSLLMMAVCNGQYFGSAMQVAPMAKIDDGILDIVIFRDFTLFNALTKLYKIYFGSHLLDKNVHYTQGKKISIQPIDNRLIYIEADGESVGPLPATFELLKDNLVIIV